MNVMGYYPFIEQQGIEDVIPLRKDKHAGVFYGVCKFVNLRHGSG
jgi:hypothetical protein